MTVDRIKVSIEGYGLWGGMEATISPEENPIDEWIKLKELVQLAMNQSDSMKGTVVRSREEIINAHLQTINECKTIRNLEMFANMVQRENEDVLYEAYNNKKKQLQ